MEKIEQYEIEKQIARDKQLFEYSGIDRVILAEDKKAEIAEERKNRAPFRAMMGIKGLDDCADGFRLGQLIVISGPPKNGKTQWCQTLTKRFTQQEHRCLWFSYELGYEELFEKFPMDTLDFYVPNYMKDGNLKWVEERIVESKKKHDTRIVFIDHLDFLKDDEILRGVDRNLASYVGSIVKRLKRIAVEQNLLIFLMSHIRKNKWTTNDLPSSEELRDTGQTAQLADMVMMVIRKRAERGGEEIYDRNLGVIGVIENRHNGKTKKVDVEFKNGEYVALLSGINEPPILQEEEREVRIWE